MQVKKRLLHRKHDHAVVNDSDRFWSDPPPWARWREKAQNQIFWNIKIEEKLLKNSGFHNTTHIENLILRVFRAKLLSRQRAQGGHSKTGPSHLLVS